MVSAFESRLFFMGSCEGSTFNGNSGLNKCFLRFFIVWSVESKKNIYNYYFKGFFYTLISVFTPSHINLILNSLGATQNEMERNYKIFNEHNTAPVNTIAN